MDSRRPSWLISGNRKTRKHTGTQEKANFDFRSNYGEDSEDSTINSALHLDHIFVFLLPFVILCVCLIIII